VGHIANKGEARNSYKILVKVLGRHRHSCIDGRMLLTWILKKQSVRENVD